MKVTTKTIKTIHLQRTQVDQNIRSCVEDIIKDTEQGTMEEFNNELSFFVRLVELAAKGEYARACREGFTMMLLDDVVSQVVNNHFQYKRLHDDNVDLNIEIYDGEVFIDRVIENQIQF